MVMSKNFINKNLIILNICFKSEERFCFLADWYDAQAGFNRRYQLLFYPADGSVELVFLKLIEI